MKSNRYLIAGLVVSVTLNLILVGLLAGRATSFDAGMRRVDPMLGMRGLIGELDEERREFLAPHFRAYFASLRPRFREIRGAQEALRQAMLSDPLDRAALEKALDAFNTHLFDTQSNAQEALITLAAALTLEERKALVAYLEKPPRRGESHHPDRPPRANRPPPPPHPPAEEPPRG